MADFIRRRRLKSVQLGIATGAVLGGYLALLNGLHCIFPGYAQTFVQCLQELYPWYRPSWWGSFLLLGWGFLDGFFALWLVGTLYNWLTQSGYGCRPSTKK